MVLIVLRGGLELGMHSQTMSVLADVEMQHSWRKIPSLKSHISSATSVFKLVPLPVWILI